MHESNVYLDKLKAFGYKITPQRLELLRSLSNNKLQTAEELHKHVTANNPNISLDTIYRNLHLLRKLNIISEINYGDGKSRFKLCGHNHHHHMICIGCGSSIELDFCPMDLTAQYIDNQKFKVTNHNFEIFGYCSKCM